MRLRNYIHQMGPDAVSAYAARCSIAVSYLRIHVKYASKDPSVSLIKALARESEGYVSLTEVLEHFGITDAALAAKTLQAKK
ncbi:hypothetical protein [Pseudomonas viridiflava]|uniref:hypothetical protein n=1 Tax=Pseudomonas viridiflava TaxID=33069 RepID=UPI000F0244D8|nr:hypothetical protein [Pseudomonas viridiflava]